MSGPASGAHDVFARLWPVPRSVTPRPGVLHTRSFEVRGEFRRDVARLASALPPDPRAPAITITITRATELAPQSYTLAITETDVRVACSDAAGARHAIATLVQLTRLSPDVLPCARIEDAPDFPVRGFMLDVSRTRVPTIWQLIELAEFLASLKYNQLQLYVEHTFAYTNHRDVWEGASPLTAADVRMLQTACSELGIDLVPNQQSFGHFHRWLKHARYRDLAEVPDGVEHAFSIDKEPYALCPGDPRALALLEELYDELLPLFPSAYVNVGLDETFDLGLGRSKAECERRGKHHVYVDFLRAVHERVRARGKRMMFWGDIVVEAPEVVPLLPNDAIALEWGYERGHPFDEHARLFAASGLEFYVCPGTSSWQSFGGRIDNMRANVREAALAGRRHGAHGYLLTDWGDRGHLQTWPVSYPGIVTAAGCAWNVASAESEFDVARLVDDHVPAFTLPGARLGDIGRVLVELGRTAEVSGARTTNGTALFFVLAFAPQGLPHPRIQDLTPAGLERVIEHAATQRRALGVLTADPHDAVLARAELEWTCDVLACAARYGLARLATSDGSSFALAPRDVRVRLDGELAELVSRHRALWVRRYRAGGLDESCGWLERARATLHAPA